jgi:hypothetical protein
METEAAMGNPVPGMGKPAMLADDERSLLRRRVHAVEKVAEMAGLGVGRLLEHTRQMEDALAQMIRTVEPRPEPARINLLAERMESLQAMLDWMVTRSGSDGISAEIVDIQTRLSMCRVGLVNVQSEILQAAAFAGSLQEVRAALADLVSEVGTLESTKAKAETLLLESSVLLASLESATQTEEDVAPTT